MKRENEMKTREEKPVIAKWEGAAIRQDHRSYGYPATRRKPHYILTEPTEPEQWSRPKTLAVTAIGALLVFALMWLTAAF